MGHGYFVALFDVLGFEDRLKKLGLAGMLSRYEALIDVVNFRKKHVQHVFKTLNFSEAPYWTAEGEVFLFTETHGAYASDSILLWGNRTWPEARNASDEEMRNSADDPAHGWTYHPVPCDNFLEICNDLMCRAVEIGLPLRGAIAIGDAVLDQDRGIFLGQPIVDAARLENGQRLIGAGFCSSTSELIVPPRFSLSFKRHIKDSHLPLTTGAMLDWPRHWRRTRNTSLHDAVSALNTDPKYAAYYENTFELIDASQEYAGRFEGEAETSIRAQYAPFSWDNAALKIKVRPVRRARISSEPNEPR